MSAATSDRSEVTRALMRFNAHVFGVILALLAAIGLFSATVVMSAQGNANPEGLLALLRHFLPGYRISFIGGFVGALWAAVIGYGLGALLGFGYGPWLLRESTRGLRNRYGRRRPVWRSILPKGHARRRETRGCGFRRRRGRPMRPGRRCRWRRLGGRFPMMGGVPSMPSSIGFVPCFMG